MRGIGKPYVKSLDSWSDLPPNLPSALHVFIFKNLFLPYIMLQWTFLGRLVFVSKNIFLIIMSTPLGGGYIIFAFFAVRCPMSGVRCPASRMVSAHLKEKY